MLYRPRTCIATYLPRATPAITRLAVPSIPRPHPHRFFALCPSAGAPASALLTRPPAHAFSSLAPSTPPHTTPAAPAPLPTPTLPPPQLPLALLGLFFGLARYTELSENAQEEVERYYKYFIDVQVGGVCINGHVY